jgi:hypothetical protein
MVNQTAGGSASQEGQNAGETAGQVPRVAMKGSRGKLKLAAHDLSDRDEDVGDQ